MCIFDYFKKILLVFTFISFFLLNAYALEPQNIKIESTKTFKLQIKGITKFLMLDLTIAKVELIKDELLITGMKTGKTALYVWSGNNFIPYVINTLTFNFPENEMVSYKEGKTNTTYGNYVVSSLNNTKDNTQLLKHSLTFKSYFEESYIDFFLNTDNTILGFKDLKELKLNDFSFGYKSKTYKLNFGNIILSTLNSYKEGMYPLQGLDFSYIPDDTKKIDFFVGVPQKPIFFIGNNNYISKDSVSLGTNIGYKPLKNLDFFCDGIFNTTEKEKSSLSLGLNLEPIKLMQIYSNLETNFIGLSNTTNISYKNIFEKTKEWLQTNFEYTYFKNNPYILNHINKSLAINFFHQSQTSLFFKGNFLKYDTNYRNIFTLGLSKNLTDKFSINANTSISKNDFDFISMFQLGFNSNYFIPSTINYTYNIDDTNSSHQINSSLNLFSSSNFNLFSNFNFKQNFQKIEGNTINNNDLFFDIGSNLIISKDFSLVSDLAYNFSLDTFNKNTKQDFVLRVSGDYKIYPIHDIKFTLFSNSHIYGKNDTFFDPNIFLTYSYSFGSLFDNLKKEGEIKGVVFDDYNGNGIFDNNEKILSNIDVMIKNDSKVYKTVKTSGLGYSFSNLEHGHYELFFDTKNLPNGYKPTGAFPELVNFSEELREINFPVSNKINITGIVYNSKEKLSGMDSVKIILDEKIIKESDLDGSFSFVAERGEHIIRLDYSTIPNNYTIIGKVSQKILLTETNNNLFFVLNPVHNLKGTIFDVLENKPASNFTFDIKYFYNNNIKFDKITTDENGDFLLRDLDSGTIEISSPFMKDKFKILVENKPSDRKINIPVIITKTKNKLY